MTTRQSDDRSFTAGKAIAIAACIVLAVIGNTVLQIWADYHETLAVQETTVRDMTKVINAHIVTSVGQADAMLDLLADIIEEDNGPALMRQPVRWKRLRAYCNGLTGCNSIAVLNPSGKVVALSDTPTEPQIDASDRVYFRKAMRTKALFVGPAVVSRVAGNPILFSIAKPVFSPAGELLAVVVAGVKTAHLTDFYGLMGFNLNPTVTVFKGNGDLVARHPHMERFVGLNYANGPLFTEQLPKAPSGVYRSHSVLDGKTRIAAYATIKDFDLIVFTGVEVDTAMQQWRIRAARTAISSAFALALILAAIYGGYRSLGRQLTLQAKNKELDRISHLDALTGIANRRLFDITLQQEWSKNKLKSEPLSLLIIDVDCFKQFNDHYGHQAGDECLRKVASALAQSLHRNVDLVARYGGEEFAAILNANEKGALAVAERIRTAVQSLAIPHAQSTASSVVTVSIGVVSTAASEARTAEELVGAADKALYDAKEQGRNRVCLFTARKLPDSAER